jgi:hypothetical protein
MPGVLKIGHTVRDSRARARELSGTSIPTPYTVAFELFSEDCEALERNVHAQLADFRVEHNREFFRYPLDKAINLITTLSAPKSDRLSAFVAEDVLDRLKEKHVSEIDPSIVGVRIVQTQDRVWLEVTRETEVAGYLKDQAITRTDLAFIAEPARDEYDLLFPPSNSVSENARRFVKEYCADNQFVNPYTLDIR